jgi:drug/metabolite transporter (DMT)-like permease
MNDNGSSPSLGTYVLLGILALIWGSSFILMKFGLFGRGDEAVMGGAELGMLRMAFAGTVLLPVALRGWRQLERRDVGWLVLVGWGGSAVPALLFADAQTELPSSISGMLNTLSPLFTLIFAALLFGARTTGRQLLGLALGFAGAFGLMTLRDVGGEIQLGAVLKILLATALYGLSINVVRNKLSHRKPLWIAAYSLGAAAIPGWILTVVLGTGAQLSQHPDGLFSAAAILILGVVGTALALVLFNAIIQRSSALFASSVTYVIPLVAISWGVMDGENIGIEHIVYGLVILSGVRLIAKTH